MRLADFVPALLKPPLRRVLDGSRHCIENSALIVTGSMSQRKFGKMILLGHSASGGSTFLNLLATHPQFYFKEEALFLPTAAPHLLLEGHACWYGRNGAWGTKVKVWQLTLVHNIASPYEFLLRCVESGWLLIHLRRMDSLRQAITKVAREERGEREYFACESFTPRVVNLRLLSVALNSVKRQLHSELELTARLPCISIRYENDILDRRRAQIVANSIFARLGLPSHDIDHSSVKVMPSDLRNIVSNYDEVVHLAREHGFEA